MTDALAPSRAEQAYDTLKTAILGGDLPPGSALVELELSARLGMSRTPIKEAIQRLVHDGLAEHARHRGAVVRGLSFEEVHNLHQLVEALEGMAAALAAERITPAQLDGLAARAARMQALAAAGDTDGWIEEDLLFHLDVLAAGQNPELERVMAQVFDRMRRVRTLIARSRGAPTQSMREHDQLIAALRARDAAAAAAVVHRHYSRVRAEDLPLVQQRLGPWHDGLL